jgi:hypothetical protein
VEEVTADEQKKVDEKIEDVKSTGAAPEEVKSDVTTSFLGKKKKKEDPIPVVVATAGAKGEPAKLVTEPKAEVSKKKK